MALNVHGVDAKIYLGDNELTEANAWSLACAADYAELVKHATEWKERLKGPKDITGSITVFHDQDSKVVQDAALAKISYALLIYPKEDDTTTYYQLSAFFDFEHGSDVGSAQAITVPFFGTGALTPVGFAS